jgi:cytoskeletal protein RodZ
VKNFTRAALSLAVSLAVAGAALLLAGSLWAQAAQPRKANQEPPPKPKPTLKASSILIEPVDPGDVLMPPDFQVAIYEYLVDQVTKTKKFEHVYRSGDKAAATAPDLVTLRTKAESFKKGSEKTREVTTVAGATKIKLKLLITDHNGKVLADPDVEGSVHFFGGNLRATYDFAKNVADVIRDLFI